MNYNGPVGLEVRLILFSYFPHDKCVFDNCVQKSRVVTGGQDGKVSSEDKERSADE